MEKDTMTTPNIHQRIEEARRTQAKTLDLRDMDLTELPKELRILTDLEELNLSCGSLDTLPDWLDSLTNLHMLNLNGCESLTTLPESLGNLTSLKSLNLS